MDGRESARQPHDDRLRRRAASREPSAGPRRLATPRLILASGAIAMVLAALLAVIAGVWRIVRGDRGGVEVTASGIFGLVGLIAAITVVM